MARLHDLPNEIMTMIVKRVPDRRSKLKFGLTCRGIYEIVKPEAFRSVTVRTNKPESALHALLLVNRHPSIKELIVIVEPAKWEHRQCDTCDTINGEDGMRMDEDNQFGRDEDVWSATSHPLLMLLRGDNPGLSGAIQKLTLELPDDCSEQGNWVDGQVAAFWENILHRIQAILRAAARSSTITTLWVYNLLSYDFALFDQRIWHEFLSRLENFKAWLIDQRALEYNNPAGQVFDDFTEFTGASLVQNFFTHMTNVKSVGIVNCQSNIEDMVFKDAAERQQFVQRFALLSKEDLGVRGNDEEYWKYCWNGCPSANYDENHEN